MTADNIRKEYSWLPFGPLGSLRSGKLQENKRVVGKFAVQVPLRLQTLQFGAGRRLGVYWDISLRSHVCARRNSRRTTCTESERAAADSSAVMPPKYRISII